MRHVKTILQLGVMWVVVFVMAAGPLPLGIPSAQAATTSTSGITDTPGIRNFYTPRLILIFDTSKSMVYRPNDPNDDPSVIGEDWDPNNPTNPCDNKLCLGKRSLYQTLPQYTARIEMGLSGYNQYYQLTSQPATWNSTCYYDEIAQGSAAWNTWKYTLPTDLTTDPAWPNMIAPGDTVAHQTRLEATNPTGLTHAQNFTGAGAAAGDTIVIGPSTYTWNSKVVAKDAFGNALTDTFSLPGAGVCANPINGYNAGTCSGAGNACDLYLISQVPNGFPPIKYGADQGASISSGGNTYTTSGATPVALTALSCSAPNPYTGPAGGCNGVIGGCALTQTRTAYPVYTATTATYYDTYNPGANWALTSTTSNNVAIQLTTYGTTCPAIGTVITNTSGPPEWQSLATGGTGPGSGPGTGCANSPSLPLIFPGLEGSSIGRVTVR